MSSKFIVVSVKRHEFNTVEEALEAVTSDTTEIREVTEHGEIGLNMGDLQAQYATKKKKSRK